MLDPNKWCSRIWWNFS